MITPENNLYVSMRRSVDGHWRRVAFGETRSQTEERVLDDVGEVSTGDIIVRSMSVDYISDIHNHAFGLSIVNDSGNIVPVKDPHELFSWFDFIETWFSFYENSPRDNVYERIAAPALYQSLHREMVEFFYDIAKLNVKIEGGRVKIDKSSYEIVEDWLANSEVNIKNVKYRDHLVRAASWEYFNPIESVIRYIFLRSQYNHDDRISIRSLSRQTASECGTYVSLEDSHSLLMEHVPLHKLLMAIAKDIRDE